MRIPSELSYIRKVSSQIEHFLRSKGVDDSNIFDIRLCLEEAVKNSIIHGNKNNKDLPVFITYSLDKDRFSVEIEDRGKGFDPDKVPDPTTEKNLLKAGGRGVFIIQKLMDEVKYNCSGTKTFMVKSVRKRREGKDAD